MVEREEGSAQRKKPKTQREPPEERTLERQMQSGRCRGRWRVVQEGGHRKAGSKADANLRSVEAAPHLLQSSKEQRGSVHCLREREDWAVCGAMALLSAGDLTSGF